MLNRMAVTIAFLTSLWFLQSHIPELFVPSSYRRLLLQMEARQIVELLMQVFLIFAVCRCLAILDDKDAVLCTVPSFSVMLLLIVVYREPAVVTYFLLWTIVAAVLFALDHRSESRFGISGSLPPVVPGQDVTMSARSLMTIICFSLLCATILSYVLTSRDPEERGTAEGWIIALATRLGRYTTLDMPEASVNSGPESQIDFSTGPVLPTRTPLWQIRTSTLPGDKVLRPLYWRMFTLTHYDGTSWTQTSAMSAEETLVPRTAISLDSWPRSTFALANPHLRSQEERIRMNGLRLPGYNVAAYRAHNDRVQSAFGAPRQFVRQEIRALNDNIGFLPALPVVREIQLFGSSPDRIRARADGSIDVGPLLYRYRAMLLSDVATGSPPDRRDEKPNPQARLSPAERELYLKLPAKLPRRVKELANRMVRPAEKQKASIESNYRRAHRLAYFVQNRAQYTLRPPVTPRNRDATDYFLFESRRGYCTYFASALTVLCRAAGIPARIVSGFTGDWEVDPQTKLAAVTLIEANAHAWTEVWVDGWGWVTLDATPPDDRGNNAPGFLANWSDLLGAMLNNSWIWFRKHAAIPIIVLVLSVLVAGVISVRRQDLLDLADLRGLKVQIGRRGAVSDDTVRDVVLQAYQRAARALARRYRHRAPWETPQEWLKEAETALELQDAQALHTLTELRERAIYSTEPLDLADFDAARTALSNVSWHKKKAEDGSNREAERPRVSVDSSAVKPARSKVFSFGALLGEWDSTDKKTSSLLFAVLIALSVLGIVASFLYPLIGK
jgi:hypothetical protein